MQRLLVTMVLFAGIVGVVPNVAQADSAIVFFGFVFEDPYCDEAGGFGLPGVDVTLMDSNLDVVATTVTLSSPPDMIGYFQVNGLVPGEIYHYTLEKENYVTIEGSFSPNSHDFKLIGCMLWEPLPVEPSTWGTIKSFYAE